MSEELQNQVIEEQQETSTEQPQTKTYDEDYVKGLRAEAAKYRTKAKEVETSTQTQQQELMKKVFDMFGLEPDPSKNYEQQLTEAQTKAQDAEQRANQRILKAEVKSQATELGIKAERLPYLLKLADLSLVEFTDGEPNAEQITAALETVLNDFPEFKTGSKPNVGGGSNPPTNLEIDYKKANKDELASELSKYGLRPWS
jgi:hypothetical protein